ncbi:MAG: translation initiation factor [Terrimicrobiaceae bacterium]|nr:translation initiation factor [Terrimicrobiaceae bacterium]
MAKKIPISHLQQPLAVNPFAGLEIGGLPAGPEPAPGRAAKKGRVVLRREKSRRGGKTVVVAGDFASHFSDSDLEMLARRAKQACGCGGTVAGREIELQGDEPARVRRFFEAEGFRVVGV